MKTHSPAHKARFKESIKGDEFYTRYQDIKAELDQYPEQFKGKTVFCPCDSSESAFVWYFNNNFERLGLKRLMAMSYGGVTGIAEKLDVVAPVQDLQKAFVPTIGTGDFRSRESRDMLRCADVIATNPPFSLKEEFMQEVIHEGKAFCIVLPVLSMNRRTFAEWFKAGRVNIEGSWDRFIYNGMERIGPRCAWFISWSCKHPNMIGGGTYTGNEHRYYIDSDGIMILDKTTMVPDDYFGKIAGPIGILYGLDRHKWKFMGTTTPVVSGRNRFERYIIQRIRTDENN